MLGGAACSGLAAVICSPPVTAPSSGVPGTASPIILATNLFMPLNTVHGFIQRDVFDGNTDWPNSANMAVPDQAERAEIILGRIALGSLAHPFNGNLIFPFAFLAGNRRFDILRLQQGWSGGAIRVAGLDIEAHLILAIELQFMHKPDPVGKVRMFLPKFSETRVEVANLVDHAAQRAYHDAGHAREHSYPVATAAADRPAMRRAEQIRKREEAGFQVLVGLPVKLGKIPEHEQIVVAKQQMIAIGFVA